MHNAPVQQGWQCHVVDKACPPTDLVRNVQTFKRLTGERLAGKACSALGGDLPGSFALQQSTVGQRPIAGGHGTGLTVDTDAAVQHLE